VNLMEALSKEEIKELLIKGWMTHDAMWFYNCMQECGIETTNKINTRAVRMMSKIEARRIIKAMGRESVRTFGELVSVFEEGASLIKANFMDFSLSYPEKNLLYWDMPSCFAHDGIKKIGAIENYECGIVERLRGWLEALGVAYELSPDGRKCMMHEKGSCRWEFRFRLE
jgi:hypothetical protein